MVLSPVEEWKILDILAIPVCLQPGADITIRACTPPCRAQTQPGVLSSQQPLPTDRSCYFIIYDCLEWAWAGKFLLLPAPPISAVPQEASAIQCPQIYLL